MLAIEEDSNPKVGEFAPSRNLHTLSTLLYLVQ